MPTSIPEKILDTRSFNATPAITPATPKLPMNFHKKPLKFIISREIKVPIRIIRKRKTPTKATAVPCLLLSGKKLLTSFTVTLLRYLLPFKNNIKTSIPIISLGDNSANFTYQLFNTANTISMYFNPSFIIVNLCKNKNASRIRAGILY